MRKLTCGFEELSLSLLEIEGNVKGVGWAPCSLEVCNVIVVELF